MIKKFRYLEPITVNQVNQKLNEIETKDLYHVLDDSNLTLNIVAKIMARELICWPPGVRILRLMCENLSYTPYFYYETDAQKNDYKTFINLLILCLNKQ